MTANDMIRQALRLAGVLASEETPTAAMAADGLQTLQDLLNSWGASEYMSSVWPSVSKSLTANVSDYTIGPSGSINSARPTAIYEAHVTYGGIDYPLRVLALEDYEAIGLKTITGIPESITLRPGYPLSTVHLFPTPLSGMTLKIDKVAPISDLTLNGDLLIPEHWHRAVKYNFAIELCAEYGAEPSAAVIAIARESKRIVMRSNVQIPDAKFDDLLQLSRGGSGYPEILGG